MCQGIIEEILSRLPAKSVLRFRCVSKSWRSLFGSKHFVKKHLQNIKKIKSYARWVAMSNCNKHGVKQCSMQSMIDDPSIVPSSIDDPKNNHLMTGIVLVGHCNGIMCILKDKEPGCFFLWNPTTRISIELPRIELSVTRKYGFGWDEGSEAYLVFAVVSEKEQNIGKVYSTKTNSWKIVDHGCLSLWSTRGKYGEFTSGKIHWLNESGHQIETFDLNSEVFGMMDQPCKPEVGESMWLYVNPHGCLEVVCQSTSNNKICTRSRVLVMKKQYAEKESLVLKCPTLVGDLGMNHYIMVRYSSP